MTVVLAMFWTDLEAIHKLKLRFDHQDPIGLWSEVQHAFLKVILATSTAAHPNQLATLIFYRTIRALRTEYHRRWRRGHREKLVVFREGASIPGEGDDMERSNPILGATWDPAFREFEERDEREHKMRRLTKLAERGLVSDDDIWIGLRVGIHGDSLMEYADSAGIDYETAKKRFKRLTAKYPWLKPES